MRLNALINETVPWESHEFLLRLLSLILLAGLHERFFRCSASISPPRGPGYLAGFPPPSPQCPLHALQVVIAVSLQVVITVGIQVVIAVGLQVVMAVGLQVVIAVGLQVVIAVGLSRTLTT